MNCNKAQIRMRALLSITLILFLGPKKDFKDICPQELIQWLDGVYEVSFDRGDGILKSELFEKVANHFNVEKSTLNQRALFECLGRHVFGKHHSFKNVKLTRGKKQIKGIIQRSQFFSGQSAKRNSRATLMSSYTRLFSSSIAVVAWPVQREHF